MLLYHKINVTLNHKRIYLAESTFHLLKYVQGQGEDGKMSITSTFLLFPKYFRQLFLNMSFSHVSSIKLLPADWFYVRTVPVSHIQETVTAQSVGLTTNLAATQALDTSVSV